MYMAHKYHRITGRLSRCLIMCCAYVHGAHNSHDYQFAMAPAALFLRIHICHVPCCCIIVISPPHTCRQDQGTPTSCQEGPVHVWFRPRGRQTDRLPLLLEDWPTVAQVPARQEGPRPAHLADRLWLLESGEQSSVLIDKSKLGSSSTLTCVQATCSNKDHPSVQVLHFHCHMG